MYTTEVFKTKAERDARYDALRGLPHLVRYTESARDQSGEWGVNWCIGFPNDLKLPEELRPGYAGQISDDRPEKPTSDQTDTQV